jgi:predicted ATPase
MQYEAVRLFVERATAVLPTFTVTPQHVPLVVQLCQRLAGLPLALELAATRIKVLSVAQIAARLEDRFRLLTGGSRTALPRHQTLRATMDWSYDLLTEPERTVWRRLSVFAGGWTLEAAESVCAGAEVDASAILELLASLVDKSVVIVEEQAGQARYRMLETTRQYGAEKLREAGETSVVYQRHRDWYLGLVE